MVARMNEATSGNLAGPAYRCRSCGLRLLRQSVGRISDGVIRRSSRARAQSDERIEYQSIDVHTLAKCTFARAKCPL
jgi:hypothetical protein